MYPKIYYIENFNGSWKEHSLALEKIQQYKDGKRFNASDYRGW